MAKAPGASSGKHPAWLKGLVVATHGRHVVVQDEDGTNRICHPRGKKSQAVVGDWVLWQASQDEGTIEKIEERKNLLYRQDELRTKSFASNLDQVLILLAAEPEFSEHQLTRALVTCESQGIAPLVVLNKSDLPDLFAASWQRLAPYQAMGYTVLPLCLLPQPEHATMQQNLWQQLAGRKTLVLGPSGVGKSTLINHCIPGALASTNEISRALNSGKHTTTHTSLYWTDAHRTTALIDSPGFQEFGIHHIGATELTSFMPDFRQHLGTCKFSNCTHLHEPHCGIRPHVNEQSAATHISPQRYRIYGELFEELSAPPRW